MKRYKKFGYDAFDFFSFAVFVLGIVLFVRFFIVNPFTVMGESMEPTFSGGDFIVVNKAERFYGGEIERKDVVVIVPPVANGTPFIKRVIGLPGETVTLSGGRVFISQNGSSEPLYEPYLPDGVETLPRCDNREVFIVPENEYFVLGDNRAKSTDSRCCFDYGCIGDMKATVAKKNVVGVVSLRIFPDFTLANNR